MATLTFPPMQRCAGLVPTGCLSIWLQLACVLAATLPSLLALMGLHVSTAGALYSLVGGLVLSRFGLWQFDLSANQLIQEGVAEGELGTVCGVQVRRPQGRRACGLQH